MKDPSLTGLKMLVLQPLAASGEAAGARSWRSIRSAGVGENVFFVRGREAAFPSIPSSPPPMRRSSIVDHWHVG